MGEVAVENPKVAKISKRGSVPGERRGGRTAGTPNKATLEVKSLAQAYGAAAIKQAARLAGLVVEDGATVGAARSEQARLTAIGLILDRAYGKAPQAIVGEDGGPVKQVLEIVWQASNGRAS